MKVGFRWGNFYLLELGWLLAHMGTVEPRFYRSPASWIFPKLRAAVLWITTYTPAHLLFPTLGQQPWFRRDCLWGGIGEGLSHSDVGKSQEFCDLMSVTGSLEPLSPLPPQTTELASALGRGEEAKNVIPHLPLQLPQPGSRHHHGGRVLQTDFPQPVVLLCYGPWSF